MLYGFAFVSISDDFVFTPAVAGVDERGVPIDETTEGQAQQALENLKRFLGARGFAFSDIAKVRVYFGEPDDYARMNVARIPFYEQHFPALDFPASTAIATGPLPSDGVRVVVEAVACHDKETFDTPEIAKTIPLPLENQPHWRLGAITGDLLWTTGQPGLDIEARLVAPGAPEQARQSLRNNEWILAARGYEARDIVRMTVFIADLADADGVRQVVDEALTGWFTESTLPVLTIVQAKMPPPGMLVEIEVIARRGERKLLSPGPDRYPSVLACGDWVFASVRGIGGEAAFAAALEELQQSIPFADVLQLTGWLRSAGDLERAAALLASLTAHDPTLRVPALTLIVGAAPQADVDVQLEVVAAAR
jgi:2-iminobutanoate/2-iminopropanoate deaminase